MRLTSRRVHLLALGLVVSWCVPMLTSGTRIERGDFSMFCQAYEAIRLSVVHYHQFPWMNPWMSGGAPLYADPQIGVFSIQTVLVLMFGAPFGLKLAIATYTVLGYGSMALLLQRHFKVDAKFAAPLSFLWISSSFFVAHLPQHFTFVWYLMAPGYIYLALSIKTLRGGLVFGCVLSAMYLSSIHDAALHITLACAVVFVWRLARSREHRKALVIALLAAIVVTLVLVGHRALVTFEYMTQYHRNPDDPALPLQYSLLGLIVPYSLAHRDWINYQPPTRYGWLEITASIGVVFNVLLVGSLVAFFRRLRAQFDNQTNNRVYLILCCGLAGLFFGIGPVVAIAPYALIKHLPVLSGMRIASRFYIFVLLAEVVFVGFMVALVVRRHPGVNRLFGAALALAIVETLVLNLGYQNTVINWDIVHAPRNAIDQPFKQITRYGNVSYREYEATRENTGVLLSNNAVLFDVQRSSKLCVTANDCPFVLSRNASVVSWSPNKIELSRTAPGAIELDMNDSRYWAVNGKRQSTHLDADVTHPMQLNVADDVGNVVLTATPRYW